MNIITKDIQRDEAISSPANTLMKAPGRRWKKRIKIRAEKIKRQLQLENRFHQAMREMCTTTDLYRRSYLHWISMQMFTLFDYESALQAINDQDSYETWLSDNYTKA